MGVGVRRVRHVVVHDMRDAGDVEPAGSDVRRDQDRVATFPEARQRAVALRLGHVSLKRDGPVACTLQLQRDISTNEAEPLTAVIPGVALSEMWRGIGYAEDGLMVISGFVVLVGLLGMLVSIYTSLDARRREMAILRALGAGPRRIVSLLVLEAGLLSAFGALLGVVFVYAGLMGLQPWLEGQFGLQVPIRALDRVQLLYIGAVVVLGFVAGLVPAIKAYRTALHDGLSVRV